MSVGKELFIIVSALVKNSDGKFLIQRRHDPGMPIVYDKWEIVGGKVEYSETPQEAAVREVKEETDLDVAIDHMVPEGHTKYWTRPDGSKYKVVLIPFVCHVTDGELMTENLGRKVAEAKFIAKDQIGQHDWIIEVDPSSATQYA